MQVFGQSKQIGFHFMNQRIQFIKNTWAPFSRGRLVGKKTPADQS
jgi:hypothetical protein